MAADQPRNTAEGRPHQRRPEVAPDREDRVGVPGREQPIDDVAGSVDTRGADRGGQAG
jgi:hypothetical protein